MAADRGTGAVVGALAAAVGLGVAELAAGVVPTGRSPVVTVADRVIRIAPGSWERALIRVLGHKDKPFLVIVILLVVLALGVLAGRWARTRPLAGCALVAGAALIGVLSALAESDSSWVDAIAPVLGAVAAVATLVLLTRAAGDDTDRPLAPDNAGRRLLLAGGVAGTVAALSGAGGRLLQGRVSATASRQAVVLPKPAQPLPPIPPGADLHVPGLSPFVTPNTDFYRIDVNLVVPQVETNGWTLRIDGMVDTPLTLTYEELLARPMVEADVTLMCVSNEIGQGLIGNARWLGVPLAGLLDEVGVHAKADQLVGRAVDGFTTGSPLQVVRDGRDALIAVGMNGEPLPIRHGFPARLVVGGLYGYVSATKWLRQIEITRFDAYDPYWIQRGWASKGPVKVGSRIDTLGGRSSAGPIPIAGVAWAQGRGVAKVEVRIDADPWREAVLGDAVGNDTWRQWRYDWEATSGKHTIAVRATTDDGEVQTGEQAPPFPDGATGWHIVSVRIS